MKPRAVSIAKAADYLGMSRQAAYRAVKAGEIRTFKIGSRYRVPVWWLEEAVGNGSTDGNGPAEADHDTIERQ